MPRPRKPASPFRLINSSPEVIRLAVMMSVKFPFSMRNIEDLLFERGIDICHEPDRLWSNRFGPMFAADIRRQRVSRMRGFRQWRWHRDEVLESHVTMKRGKSAALVFLKKAFKRHGRAEKIVTGGMRSYPAAMREMGNLERREMGRSLNKPGGKQPSPIPSTGACHAAIQEDEVIGEIRPSPGLV